MRYARERLLRKLVAAWPARRGDAARHASVLDPSSLTLGFARRFASYKRPNLLLADPERLLRLLTDARAARCSSSSPARRIPATRKARR